MNLVFNDYWVDDVVKIIGCNKVDDFGWVGFWIDFYFVDIGVWGEGKVGWIIEGIFF